MIELTPEQTASSYLGHVKNGVIVLDETASLKEGQAVRVEPLKQEIGTESASDRGDRVHRMEQLFTAWTEEDGKLSEEDADRLAAALEQSRGSAARAQSLLGPVSFLAIASTS
jgi:GAF domain-containing protein